MGSAESGINFVHKPQIGNAQKSVSLRHRGINTPSAREESHGSSTELLPRPPTSEIQEQETRVCRDSKLVCSVITVSSLSTDDLDWIAPRAEKSINACRAVRGRIHRDGSGIGVCDGHQHRYQQIEFNTSFDVIMRALLGIRRGAGRSARSLPSPPPYRAAQRRWGPLSRR